MGMTRSLLLPAALAMTLSVAFADDTAKKSKDDAGSRPAPVKLFAEKGEPKGWVVRAWNDVSRPHAEGGKWVVDDEGVLHGSDPRGTWLVSEANYGDFELEFEFKLGEQGNGGCGVRFPDYGDPAFDGLELQMADERYNGGRDTPDKLTASFYKALAPSKQVYKPTEWNHYVITCKGPHVKVVLNGETVQDVNLDEHTAEIERHDGSPAKPLKDRPRLGNLGFQELSRGGGHVQIRNATIKVFDEPAEGEKKD